MPRGKPKGGHKGRSKHYITPEEIAEQEEKRKRELEWKKSKGRHHQDGDEDEAQEENSDGDGEDGVVFSKAGPRDQGDDSEEEEEESSDDDDDIDAMFQREKPKGVSDLIEIENPNRVRQKNRKITDIDVNAKVELSRREREELEKQKRENSYRKKHDAGLTDEAQRDLARLAIIKKQREEMAKKRELEKQKASASAASKKK